MDTALIVFGGTDLGPALPWVLGASAAGPAVTVFPTQRRIGRIDTANKGSESLAA